MASLWNLFSVVQNQLTGEVPAFMSDITQQVNVDLEGNQLSSSTDKSGADGSSSGSTGSTDGSSADSSGGGGGLSTGAIVGISVGSE